MYEAAPHVMIRHSPPQRFLKILFVFLAVSLVTCETVDDLFENIKSMDREVPSIPENLVISEITSTAMVLSWNPSTDNVKVVRYVVYQNDIQVSNDSITSYQSVGLVPETVYSYEVRAIDAVGNISDFSSKVQVTTEKDANEGVKDTIPPTAPSNLIASNTTQTTTELNWVAATDEVGALEYIVFQDVISIATVTETTYPVTGLLANTTYDFTVLAIDSAGNESPLSNVESVTTVQEKKSAGDRILVFTKTAGFRHTSILKGINTLKDLGIDNDFEVDQTENASDFNMDNLQKYKTVVFLNTTGDVLNNAQQTAFENYIKGGGSYMGIHSATDTEYDWSWYGQLIGAYFNGHPAIQEASIDVVDRTHPSTEHLSATWVRTDEWYNFKDLSSNITILLKLDETSYEGGTNSIVHPIAWHQEFDGGRSFYTGGGHTEESYDEPDFRAHLLGGLKYCLRRE